MLDLAPLLVSAVILGLLGGGHCLGMCGGLMGALTLAAFMLGVGAGRQAEAQAAPDKPIVRIAELEIDPAQIED